MNQVGPEFSLKIFINYFCKIKLKFHKDIVDTWNYIVINFQVKWSLRTYYFKGSNLLD